MRRHYPVKYETGDIVFTCIGSVLFGRVSVASRCWCNHVGMITGHNGRDYLVAESRIPFSTVTTLSRFIARSAGGRYAVCRMRGELTEAQKHGVVAQVRPRLHKLYHTGFSYDSSRQFCSKFVSDICHDALSVRVGKIETFGELLSQNPDSGLTFWKCWFLGSVPWSRRTITPASLWRDPNLVRIYDSRTGEVGGSVQRAGQETAERRGAAGN
ncbi:TPA: YebB family permuted papain-like enzyme [Klebsiella oxytoca]|uniref:YebB family permuted papain-like enzyme n=1 Tax=Klebsiella oxytoca TaxID=571 RepID=A0AAN5L787_KLEOX|nr:YebB family permuted papain-like enzyme [Klebsiella oxytoca]